MNKKSENDRPSRLDPEAMPRRDFLGLAALGSACAAGVFALAGSLRLPKAAVLASASRKFKLTLPEALPPGEAFVPPGRAVAVFREGSEVYAISTVCTHLGCIVKPSPTGFNCPCHGSKFAPDGAVIRGPAPKALPWLQVRAEGGGAVTIDESSEVPPGTKESV